MGIRRFVVPVTTDGSGDATAYTPKISGRVVSIRYVKTDFASGVDFVITAETAGQTIWSENDVNASATRYPRTGTHSTAGVAALYAAAGTAVNSKISLADDRVKFVIASGGDTKTGAFHVTVEG